MLVLTRKKNESIMIDGGIVIEILQINRDQIRIGVTAPSEVKVLRGELRPFSQQPTSFVSLEKESVGFEQAGIGYERAGADDSKVAGVGVPPLAHFIANGNRLQSVREPDAVFQTSSQEPCRLKIAFAS